MSLLKNAGWNVIGTAVSALAMVLAMAYMARRLDIQSFGLLGLALAFVGYASVLDGGFARAVVREVSLLGADDESARKILGTAVRIVFLIGLSVAVMGWFLVPWMIRLLEVNAAIKDIAIDGFRVIALMMPVVVLTMVWLAPLEGRHRFAMLNQIRVLGFSIMFAMSVMAVAISPTFFSAVCGLFVGRCMMATISWRASVRLLGDVAWGFDRESLNRLFRFGGWLTVTNIVTPLLDYLDRFVLSVIGGISEVAYYAAPADAIQKMQALPGAISRALFPMLSKNELGPEHRCKILRHAILMQAFIGIGAAIVIGAAGESIVSLWLGEAYVIESTIVLQILAVGFVFNAIAWVPQTALQAQGFSRQTAVISICQVVPYILMLVAFTIIWGIKGAAYAWVIRAFIDLGLLVGCYRQLVIRREVAS